MKRLLCVLFVLLFAAPVMAQVANPASKLGWDQVGQTVVSASAATYNIYVDSAAPVPLLNFSCSSSGGATGPTTCVAPFPALTPGVHNLTLTQVIGAQESAKSTPVLAITFVVVVSPSGVRIIP